MKKQNMKITRLISKENKYKISMIDEKIPDKLKL